MRPIEILRDRLEQHGCDPRGPDDKFEFRCPVHDDQRASAGATIGTSGDVVLFCQVCGKEGTEEILSRLGLTFADLLDGHSNGNGNGKCEIVNTYPYVDETGELLYQVVKYSPKTFKQRRPDGGGGWVWKLGDTRRVLYHLPQLVAAIKTGKTVYVVEGEKDVESVERAGAVATCNPMGAGKWRPEYNDHLHGADVIIVADRDDKGREHALAIRAALNGTDAKIVEPAVGKDVTDHLNAGKSLAELVELPTAQRAASGLSDLLVDDILAKSGLGAEDLEGVNSMKELMKLLDHRKKDSVATAIVNAVKESGAVLWHDVGARGYATVEIDGHRQTHAIKSRTFKLFARRCYYRGAPDPETGEEAETKGAPSGTSVTDACAQLEAEALFDGEELDVHLRVAEQDKTIYIDLGDDDWRCIAITRAGWTVLDQHPVRFRRSGSMTALAEPVRGGTVDLLRPFVNVKDEAVWKLVVGFLVAALRPGASCPLLVLHGEQGSAKSTAARIVRSLVDPNASPLRSSPSNNDDLMVGASAGHIVAYDNLSHLEPWLSDAICRLVTGGGLSKRELYTDSDEHVLDCKRPVIINGIEELATRSDLLDRSLMVELPVISETDRMDEKAFWERFDAAAPKILGALCDAVACALQRLDSVKLERTPRMADFAKWVTAAEPALGWKHGSFIEAYSANRVQSNDIAIESASIGPYICAIADKGFEGTPAELLAKVTSLAGEAAKSKSFPKSAQALTTSLKRLGPNLRRRGYIYERSTGRPRIIRLERQEK